MPEDIRSYEPVTQPPPTPKFAGSAASPRVRVRVRTPRVTVRIRGLKADKVEA